MKLNPYSQHLLQYIKKTPNPTHKPRFSAKSKQFLHKILRQIKSATKTFQAIPREPPQNPTKNDLYSYIPPKIRAMIESNPLDRQSYQFTIQSRTIDVHFAIPHNKPTIVHDEIQTALKLIYSWFYVASQYATNPKCASSLQLYLYLIPHRKVLPHIPGEPIDEIHANTAFTWACKSDSTIQIFREEEWFKVLIHETFHTLGLDFAMMDIAICRNKIQELFDITTDGLLFESYCETWATLLNAVFLAHHSAATNTTAKVLNAMENLLQQETKYAMFQSVKVLNHYHLTYSDLVEKSPRTKPHRNRYREKTNVFCYNVLKALMLYYLDDFLVWCIDNNGGFTMEFQKTSQILENFCKWIEIHYKNPTFLEDYHAIEDWYRSSPRIEQNKYLYSSMRMTIFG